MNLVNFRRVFHHKKISFDMVINQGSCFYFRPRLWAIIELFSARRLNSTLPQIDVVKRLYVRTVELAILIQMNWICRNPTIGRGLIREKKHVKVTFINHKLVGGFACKWIVVDNWADKDDDNMLIQSHQLIMHIKCAYCQ